MKYPGFLKIPAPKICYTRRGFENSAPAGGLPGNPDFSRGFTMTRRIPKPTRNSRGAVLITGVSSGIGKALALQLLRDGYRVLGTVRKKSDGEYLRKAGGVPLRLDVTEHKRLPAAVRRVRSLLGSLPLAALVNNAGLSLCGSWEHLSLDEVRAQFEVNFFSVVAVTRAFLPLIRSGRGRILLISSTSARFPFGLMGAYASSKSALEAFAITLRQELYSERIPVICLQPGPTKTLIFEKARRAIRHHHPREIANGYYDPLQKLSCELEQGGLAPEVAAGRIAKILQKPHPPLRAVISSYAAFDHLVPLIPQRVIDFFVNRWRQRPLKSSGGF